MNLNLSWDLFILVFFAVVTAYSFIIGKNQTLKVITATYVAILCSDGIGNLFARYLASSEAFLKFMRLFSIGNAEQSVAFFKVSILILLVVMFAVRALYTYDMGSDGPMSMKLSISMLLGVLSAGLMLSAMLVFVSGTSLVNQVAVLNNPLTEIYAQSRLVRIMLDYSNMWFFMPGMTILVMSFLDKKNG